MKVFFPPSDSKTWTSMCWEEGVSLPGFSCEGESERIPDVSQTCLGFHCDVQWILQTWDLVLHPKRSGTLVLFCFFLTICEHISDTCSFDYTTSLKNEHNTQRTDQFKFLPTRLSTAAKSDLDALCMQCACVMEKSIYKSFGQLSCCFLFYGN